jgi:putative membrane protein
MRPMWKNGTLVAAGMVFALSGALVAQKTDSSATGGNATTTSNKTSSADMKFAKDAAIGGLEEVELGKLAVQKASNEKVKQFGQRMVDDHSKASDELKSVAAKDNITIPSDLDAKHKAMVDKYSNLSGTAFDRAYMKDMVKDHQMDVAEFQKEASNGSNYDLKSWAGTTLPILQEHLRMAREAESGLSSTSSTK